LATGFFAATIGFFAATTGFFAATTGFFATDDDRDWNISAGDARADTITGARMAASGAKAAADLTQSASAGRAISSAGVQSGRGRASSCQAGLWAECADAAK